MFRGKRYNDQERPNISHGKVLEKCISILVAQPKTIGLINEMFRVPVNRYYIRAKNRVAHNFKYHQIEQNFANEMDQGMFHDTVFNINGC